MRLAWCDREAVEESGNFNGLCCVVGGSEVLNAARFELDKMHNWFMLFAVSDAGGGPVDGSAYVNFGGD